MRSAPLEVPPLELPNATLRVDHWQRPRGKAHNGGWIRVEPRDGSPAWEMAVYSVTYDLFLEEDVQDNFILRLEAEPLVVVDEAGRKFRLCLETRSVTQEGPDPWIERFRGLSEREVADFFRALRALEPPAETDDPFAQDPFARDPFAQDCGFEMDEASMGQLGLMGPFGKLGSDVKKRFWQVCWADLAPHRWGATAALMWGGEFADFPEVDPNLDETSEWARDQLQQRLMGRLAVCPELTTQQLRDFHQEVRQQLGLPPHAEGAYLVAAAFVEEHYRESLPWEPDEPELEVQPEEPAEVWLEPPLEVALRYLQRLGLAVPLEGPDGSYWRGLCAHYLQACMLRSIAW